MKKNYLIVLFALFTFALNVNAQGNETGQDESYNMVVKMPDGTTVTISTDDVDEVSFSNGSLVVTGESLNEILNQLETSIALLTAEMIMHYEEAKVYADKQTAAAILQMENWVKDQLKDYLMKCDIDLSRYVTKEDINNFKQYVKDTFVTKLDLVNCATLDDLKNYVSEDTWNAFVAALNDKLNGIDSRLDGLDAVNAALSIALQNLTTEMNNKFVDQANTVATLRDRIATLEALYNTLRQMSSNFVTKEDFDNWKEYYKTQMGNYVSKEELLSGSFAEKLAGTLIDDYGFMTQDDIAGLSEALVRVIQLETTITSQQEQIEVLQSQNKAQQEQINTLTSELDAIKTALRELQQK